MPKADDAPTTSRRTALAGLLTGTAAAAMGTAAVASDSTDAELIRLGALFDAANVKEQAAWAAVERTDEDDGPNWHLAEELQGKTGRIVDRIEAIRATTAAGVLVKTRAVMWCRCWSAFARDDFDPFEGSPATESRLLVGLLNDLSAMARTGEVRA